MKKILRNLFMCGIKYITNKLAASVLYLLINVAMCVFTGARYSSVVRAFTHDAMDRRIDP